VIFVQTGGLLSGGRLDLGRLVSLVPTGVTVPRLRSAGGMSVRRSLLIQADILLCYCCCIPSSFLQKGHYELNNFAKF